MNFNPPDLRVGANVLIQCPRRIELFDKGTPVIFSPGHSSRDYHIVPYLFQIDAEQALVAPVGPTIVGDALTHPLVGVDNSKVVHLGFGTAVASQGVISPCFISSYDQERGSGCSVDTMIDGFCRHLAKGVEIAYDQYCRSNQEDEKTHLTERINDITARVGAINGGGFGLVISCSFANLAFWADKVNQHFNADMKAYHFDSARIFFEVPLDTTHQNLPLISDLSFRHRAGATDHASEIGLFNQLFDVGAPDFRGTLRPHGKRRFVFVNFYQDPYEGAITVLEPPDAGTAGGNVLAGAVPPPTSGGMVVTFPYRLKGMVRECINSMLETGAKVAHNTGSMVPEGWGEIEVTNVEKRELELLSQLNTHKQWREILPSHSRLFMRGPGRWPTQLK